MLKVKEFFKKLKENDNFKKIVNITLWALLFIWMIICIWDFTLAKQNKEPKFCIVKSEKSYVDGTTTKCTGLLYKVFRYDRESIEATDFTHIFAKEKYTDN